ncbi:MAG: polysaccharide biosynthesis protein [Actinobacteria bacterium]|nr:polysaccharide biosynthesis protein [Actinomycetota bacterium]
MIADVLRNSAAGRGRLASAVLVALDAAVIALATVCGYFIRFEGAPPAEYAARLPLAIAAGAAAYLLLFAAFGLYRQVLRYVGVDTVLRLAGATVLGVAALITADFLYTPDKLRVVPVSVLLVQWLLTLLGGAAVRLSVRIFAYVGRTPSAGRRVLIVGAGDAGSLLLRDIEAQPDLGLRVVGFLDDDPAVQHRTIRSVPVVGTTRQLADAVQRHRVEEVLVALPSAPNERVRDILNAAADAGLKTRVMPRLVIEKGAVALSDLRKVEIEDLLGREPAAIDVEQVRETIAGRVVAVTGAAGSIGSELCRQVLTLGPKRLVLIEIDESRLYELWMELERTAPGVAAMHICDIRDATKLDAVFAAEKPEVVLHAAAYKHVPLMELEPDEAVKTNVLGTRNVIEACEKHGAERFLLISTDKAVAPQSVMGMTKAIAERLMLDACCRGTLKCVAVRFGNVLGSRGSVVPLFEEQLKRGGPILVTDEEVTRYFMTIPEAARLVLQAQAISEGGDLFVLEMGEPVRIVDLAKKMIALSGVPADIEIVGLRPAEKMHEVLVQASEELVPTGREKILQLNALPLPAEGYGSLVADLADKTEAGPEALREAVRRLL